MNTAIEVGSVVIGKSGKSLVVDRVDAEFVHGHVDEASKKQLIKIYRSQVARVIPPADFAIYDYAIYGDIVFIVDRVEPGFVGGWSETEPISYIGGCPSLFTHKGKWWGSEFVKEVSNW
jgi:hypothetical protein